MQQLLAIFLSTCLQAEMVKIDKMPEEIRPISLAFATESCIIDSRAMMIFMCYSGDTKICEVIR